MKNYLLIHGSWHGAWCWYKIAPRLRDAGHKVIVPDLLGRKGNAKIRHLISLSRMAADVARLLPDNEKTTVVVHSRYGILASTLAQMVPEKIERTIYLASFMLPTGTRVVDYFRKDKDSVLAPFITVNNYGLWDYLDPEIYRNGLYHDCSEEDNMLGQTLLCREPVRPALSKLTLTDDRYGAVPRAYIRLSEDRAVSPYIQDRCLNKTPVERVEELKSSHSAYFSIPDQLTQKILKLSKN